MLAKFPQCNIMFNGTVCYHWGCPGVPKYMIVMHCIVGYSLTCLINWWVDLFWSAVYPQAGKQHQVATQSSIIINLMNYLHIKSVVVCPWSSYQHIVDNALDMAGDWIKQVNAALSAASKIPEMMPMTLDNLAYVVYSSGTTGKPKGIKKLRLSSNRAY